MIKPTTLDLGMGEDRLKTQTSVTKDSRILAVDILLFSRVLLELKGLWCQS
jgi:hypothetical protein